MATCSALKKAYRDLLRSFCPRILFLHLRLPFAVSTLDPSLTPGAGEESWVVAGGGASAALSAGPLFQSLPSCQPIRNSRGTGKGHLSWLHVCYE